jgi:PadR family transcriptional regulator AphA
LSRRKTVARKLKDLTTTSYALLAHLAVRPWSAFELAKQMTRGMDVVWPRAESAIYEEPKNLVAHGLATARTESSGPRRSRTVYAITSKGRRALREWLEMEPSPPQFESEGLLKVFFAEHGSKESLQTALKAFERYGTALKERHRIQIQGYIQNGGPFPERWHLIGIGARLLVEYGLVCERWSKWAQSEVRGWKSTSNENTARGEELLREILALIEQAEEGRGQEPD